MNWKNVGRAIVVAASLLMPSAAGAQALDGVAPIPPADVPNVDAPPPAVLDSTRSLEAMPSSADPLAALPPAGGLPGSVTPYAPPDMVPDLGGLDLTPAVGSELVLSAKLTEDGKPLRSGVVWRVFGEKPGPDGKLPMVAQANGGTAQIRLQPGVYLVHCGFGYAGRTDRIEVGKGIRDVGFVLNAGGLKLQATASEDRPLKSDDLSFDVYSMQTDERGERKPVALNVPPGDLLRLTADTYYVVSHYGSVNAQTHADVEVKAGKLSEVTLYQKAAEVTLKLVGEAGGEAIADTKWSILTPGGDIVTEGVGAFPSFILAAGGYTVIAKHDDQVFQREFDVESGLDAEVEVLATAAAPREYELTLSAARIFRPAGSAGNRVLGRARPSFPAVRNAAKRRIANSSDPVKIRVAAKAARG